MKDVMIDLVEALREHIDIDFTTLQDLILEGKLEETLKKYDETKVDIK